MAVEQMEGIPMVAYARKMVTVNAGGMMTGPTVLVVQRAQANVEDGKVEKMPHIMQAMGCLMMQLLQSGIGARPQKLFGRLRPSIEVVMPTGYARWEGPVSPESPKSASKRDISSLRDRTTGSCS